MDKSLAGFSGLLSFKMGVTNADFQMLGTLTSCRDLLKIMVSGSASSVSHSFNIVGWIPSDSDSDSDVY